MAHTALVSRAESIEVHSARPHRSGYPLNLQAATFVGALQRQRLEELVAY